MKNLYIIGLVIILAIIIGMTENNDIIFESGLKPKGNFVNGILESSAKSYKKVANYNIKVNFEPSSKYIYVNEEISWHNLTKYTTNEVWLHFYPNAYKSNNTIFAASYYLAPEARTEVEVSSITADGKPAGLNFFQPETHNPNDSTVAKIVMDRKIRPSDSVKINITYKMKIPRSVKRLGYATGRNFFFVSQWFPKVGVFEDGKWICSQYYAYVNFFSDFGDYDVQIEVPENYVVGATGEELTKTASEGKNHYRFIQNGVHDFVWFAADEIFRKQKLYKRNDGSEILINAFVQPERRKYFDRYFAAVENSLRFFENKIGTYPYHTVTLVDVPRTCNAGGMEYPTLFTVGADLFSPEEIHEPEGVTVHEFSHQFFYGMLANNEVFDAWLDEGFTTYITEKILSEYYGKEILSFKLAGYVPFYGMNLYSFFEIPVVYTMTSIYKEEGANSLESYYDNPMIGAIADTSYKLPNRSSYVVNSYHKPCLALLTLEKYVGYDKMMNILKEYFNTYKFSHPKAKDFYSIVQKNCTEDMTWFFNNFFEKSDYFDYKLCSLTKKGDEDYEVLVERLGDGIFKSDIALYTTKETLIQKWDGTDRWKVFKFKTNDEVVGAEIDPKRKNLLDINFANNSVTVRPRYRAAISLAMRWLFWIQNALMTLGGLG